MVGPSGTGKSMLAKRLLTIISYPIDILKTKVVSHKQLRPTNEFVVFVRGVEACRAIMESPTEKST